MVSSIFLPNFLRIRIPESAVGGSERDDGECLLARIPVLLIVHQHRKIPARNPRSFDRDHAII
jgi:hypothetical protein